MQGVLSRGSFRRPPLSGQKTFTVMSLHISKIYTKKRSIAKKFILTIRAIMIDQQIDLVAGDFIGTAWRYRSRDNLSTILTNHLRIVPCLRHRAPHHCGDLDPFLTDFFVHDDCFLRELVGVPNPVGDDRKE